MAQVAISPGVTTNELEEAFSPVGAGAIGAALVGLTKKGPAFLPVEVGSFGEYRQIFGGLDNTMHVPYAARSYLKNSGTLNVVRVLGRSTASVGTSVILSFPPATTVGSATGVSADTAAISGSNTVLGMLRLRGDNENVMVSGTPTNFTVAIPGKGVTAANLSLSESSNKYVKKVLGVDPVNTKSGDALTALYVDAVFDYQVSSVTGSISGAAADGLLSTATSNSTQVTGGFSPGKSPTIVSQNFNGQVYDLFQVHTRSDGDAANGSYKISVTQVDTTSTASPTFTVLVRDANDTDRSTSVIESYENVNLDRTSKKFIGKVIGDRRPVYDLTQDPPQILFDGEYDNRSSIIRVQVEDGFPATARPSGWKGIDKVVPGGFIPELPTVDNHLNGNSIVDNNIFLGVNFDLGGILDRSKKTTTSASGTLSADSGVLYFGVSGDLSGSGSLTTYNHIDLVGSNSGNFSSTNKVRFTVPIFNGFDGLDPRSDKLVDVNDGTLSADFSKALDTLANSDEIDTNLIVAPGVHSSSVGNIPQKVIDVCANRGDSFSIIDLSDATTTAGPLALSVAAAQSEADKYDTNYAAAYYPWVRISDPDNDKLVWVPPSVEMMGVYAFNDRVAQPWYAPAGFTRGGMESALEARRRLTSGQRDDLYSRSVNPIATFPGQGLAVWGQKTLQKKQSFLDRVNVRRMLLTVRKTIASFSKAFIFEPNTTTLRSRLSTRINSYLDSVQRANGLNEFRAILDDTTTTPDLIDRNIIKGKIFLKPTTAAEFIILDFNVSPNGAVFED